MQKSNQKGFTLIELMIVVAIIGILAAVALPQYQSYVQKSKFAETISAVNNVKSAFQQYALVEGDLNGAWGVTGASAIGITQASVQAGENVTSVVLSGVTTTAAVITGTSGDTNTYILTAAKATALADTTWTASGTCSALNWC